MWYLYALGIPYVWYTLTRWRMPSGHGLDWREPRAYSGYQTGVYGGVNWEQNMEDLGWHPDDPMRSTATAALPVGEPYHVPFWHREKGVAGECC